jgi:hypothetical protein
MAEVKDIDISVSYNLFVDEKGLCADKIITIKVQPIMPVEFIELTINQTETWPE